MKRYILLLLYILSFHLRSAVEYRFNFFLKILYAPAYVGVLFWLVKIAYQHTAVLRGWSETEAYVLFGVFHLVFSVAILFYMQSVRFYLSEGFRYGALDSILLKPANVQFLATFSRPEIQQLPLTIFLIAFTLYKFSQLHISLFSFSFLIFIMGLVVSFTSLYFFITTFMTLGFYVVKATQVIEFLDKVADYAQYPPSIFPLSIQAIFFTIIPVAFFGYVPAAIILGKHEWYWIFFMAFVALCLYTINQLVWREAIKHYSSASS